MRTDSGHEIAMDDMSANRSTLEPRIGAAALICALFLSFYLALVIGCAVLIGPNVMLCFEFMYFRGAVGIPAAIIASVSIVALLAAGVGGEFKIKLWALTLEGPSAPITMWVVCFLSICVALFILFPEVKSIEALPPVLSNFCKTS